ncbi:MAG: hypothetical protein WAU34_09850, partial [Desulfobacterales bacterium]
MRLPIFAKAARAMQVLCKPQKKQVAKHALSSYIDEIKPNKSNQIILQCYRALRPAREPDSFGSKYRAIADNNCQ